MHDIQRKILIGVLAAGTVLGFGAGFASLRGHACHRRAALERRVADVCVEAARRQAARGDAEAGGGRGGETCSGGERRGAP